MRSWCFDSVATEIDGVTTYDREYGSAEFREVLGKLVGNGVYANPANNMQVTVGDGMDIVVQPGYCWIQGALGVVDEAETLTIDTSTSGRMDLVVARFDLSLNARDIHLAVVKGTEGSFISPQVTRTQSVYEIILARVRVNANVSNISLSDITDTRFNKDFCGIVTGVIDQIDTTGLFAQYESRFYSFLRELENTLTGDVAGNLLTLINNHTKSTDNPHKVTKEQVGLGNVLNEQQYCVSNPPTTEVGSVTLEWDKFESIDEESAFDNLRGFFITVTDNGGALKDSFFLPFGSQIYGDITAEFRVGTMAFGKPGYRHLILTNRNQGTRIVHYMGID